MIKMKLNKREKILIGVLALLLIGFLLYSFILKPQRAKLNELKSDRRAKLDQLSALKEEISSESKLYIELLSLEDYINNKAEGFFTKVTQEDIILLVEELSNTAKLKVPDIDFPEGRVEEVILKDPEEAKEVDGVVEGDEETEKLEEPLTEEELAELPKVELKVNSADLKYEGYYYSFLDFLKSISEYEKKIIVKDINVSKDEDGYLRGNIALDFYSIENIMQDGEEVYAWGPNLGYVVGDPFSQFGDYEAQKRANEDKGKSDYTQPASNGNSGSSQASDSDNRTESDFFTAIKDRIDNIGKGNKDNGSDNSSKKDDDTEFIDRGKTVLDFDKKDTMFFVGNNRDIKGSLEINKKKKTQGEGSLNLKYDFVEKRKHNMANISFNNNVLIREQPETLTLSVQPIEKNDAALGVVIRDREGVDYKLELTDNLNWNGFKTLGVDLPIDINYPAIVERIYVETIDFNVKLTGDLLIDDMRLIYETDLD